MSTVKPRRDFHTHRLLKPAFASSHSPYVPRPADPGLTLTHKRPALLISRRRGIEKTIPRPGINLPKIEPVAMDVQPISPFFGKENKNPVCDVEEICLPYELEDTLRPKALRKADCNAQRQSVKKGGRPPADLKRGAFSRKQTFGLVMGNISVLSEQDTSLDHSILEYPSANISFIDTIAVKADSRSQSPITTGRNNKIQQLSRRFKLNKVELAKQVHRGQTRSEEPPPGLRAKPGGREETLMPTFSFLRDLQDLLSLS